MRRSFEWDNRDDRSLQRGIIYAMKFAAALTGKRGGKWAVIVLVMFSLHVLFSRFDSPRVAWRAQNLTVAQHARDSPLSLNVSESRVIVNATSSVAKRTLAIIVVTDITAANTSWIVGRLAHFKCYATAQKYDFIHHVIDMASYPEVSFYTARWKAIVDNYWGKYDWVFAHDTDSLYPDFSVSLQKFIESDEAPAVHLLARGTEIGANALLFRAKNSSFSETFMRRLISLGYRIPRPRAFTNFDVRDVMMVVLELIHPELATLCQTIEDFFEFARCFTPAIERIPLLPNAAVPIKIHLPMSGFVQQFEAPASEYGLLFGTCWPGHVLLSGNGVKGRAPYPRSNSHSCARDGTMNTPCAWLSRAEQLNAAHACCLLQASVCDDHGHSCARVEGSSGMHTMSDKLSCKVGWPVLWAGGGEVVDPSVPRCGAPYIALKQRGIEWNNAAYFETFSAQLAAR